RALEQRAGQREVRTRGDLDSDLPWPTSNSTGSRARSALCSPKKGMFSRRLAAPLRPSMRTTSPTPARCSSGSFKGQESWLRMPRTDGDTPARSAREGAGAFPERTRRAGMSRSLRNFTAVVIRLTGECEARPLLLVRLLDLLALADSVLEA